MGTYVKGDFTIELKEASHAPIVLNAMALLQTRSDEEWFDIHNICVNDTIIEFCIQSDRGQNGCWQVEELVNELRRLVEERQIVVLNFDGSLMSDYESWSLDEDNFSEEPEDPLESAELCYE